MKTGRSKFYNIIFITIRRLKEISKKHGLKVWYIQSQRVSPQEDTAAAGAGATGGQGGNLLLTIAN